MSSTFRSRGSCADRGRARAERAAERRILRILRAMVAGRSRTLRKKTPKNIPPECKNRHPFSDFYWGELRHPAAPQPLGERSMSHDQLSKSLLETFFPDFLHLIAPDSAPCLRPGEAIF